MILIYKGYNNCNSHCGIEVIENMVILTELESNKGTSITNMCETLADMVCDNYKIPKQDLIFIEHYPKDGFMYKEDEYFLVKFDIVDDKFTCPMWKAIGNTREAAIKTVKRSGVCGG